MKHNKIILIIIALFVCASMHAQVAPNASGFEFSKGKFYQNGVELTSDQLCAVIGQQAFDTQYTSGKGLRTAGIATLSAGGGVFVIGGGLMTYGIISGNSSASSAAGATIATGVGIITASVGAVAAITGGILLGAGNKKLRNIVPASSGAGLALVF